MSRALHLFYQDLRLRDNPALSEACLADSLLLLYVFPEDQGPLSIGSASKAWLGHSLERLSNALKEKGMKLCFDKGPWAQTVGRYLKECGITDLYFNIPIDGGYLKVTELENLCKRFSVKVHFFDSSILFDPDKIRTGSGSFYQVFTPFSKACLKADEKRSLVGIPRSWPKSIKASSRELKELKLLPHIHWDTHFYDFFEVGEEGAQKTFKSFIKTRLSHYAKQRDYPAIAGTSKLSPHLHFGEISIQTVWNEASGVFRNELLWREFAHHLLVHFPKTPLHPLKESFKDFPWKNNASLLKKWQKGMTGYPIVDAGMRQLWKTGWMHNRVRMIVGSFLVKDLLIPWQEGAKWFFDTLVDADIANNTLGWQWVAGCGADAAPFFRIFNPKTQSIKFDPDGTYIKTYVEELSKLDKKYIHAPHEAPQEVLEKAGIVLGKTYPYPIVDHDEARKKALKLYQGWNR